uniref:Ebbc90d1-8659-407b-bf24-00b965af4b3d-CDS n=1 Tax=Plasmodiophora brassicae TaxID=37360 RepID=A0A3P3YWB6_PLABS|nr:ebbc90d1-8659-407b-bf24-00b965af4b3d-CDS [Plasmodiophora brassicae]
MAQSIKSRLDKVNKFWNLYNSCFQVRYHHSIFKNIFVNTFKNQCFLEESKLILEVFWLVKKEIWPMIYAWCAQRIVQQIDMNFRFLFQRIIILFSDIFSKFIIDSVFFLKRCQLWRFCLVLLDLPNFFWKGWLVRIQSNINSFIWKIYIIEQISKDSFIKNINSIHERYLKFCVNWRVRFKIFSTKARYTLMLLGFFNELNYDNLKLKWMLDSFEKKWIFFKGPIKFLMHHRIFLMRLNTAHKCGLFNSIYTNSIFCQYLKNLKLVYFFIDKYKKFQIFYQFSKFEKLLQKLVQFNIEPLLEVLNNVFFSGFSLRQNCQWFPTIFKISYDIQQYSLWFNYGLSESGEIIFLQKIKSLSEYNNIDNQSCIGFFQKFYIFDINFKNYFSCADFSWFTNCINISKKLQYYFRKVSNFKNFRWMLGVNYILGVDEKLKTNWVCAFSIKILGFVFINYLLISIREVGWYYSLLNFHFIYICNYRRIKNWRIELSHFSYNWFNYCLCQDYFKKIFHIQYGNRLIITNLRTLAEIRNLKFRISLYFWKRNFTLLESQLDIFKWEYSYRNCFNFYIWIFYWHLFKWVRIPTIVNWGILSMFLCCGNFSLYPINSGIVTLRCKIRYLYSNVLSSGRFSISILKTKLWLLLSNWFYYFLPLIGKREVRRSLDWYSWKLYKKFLMRR